MISCINPSYISSNHTINTLRYSDRLKEQTAYMQKLIAKNKNINNNNHHQVSNNQNNNKKDYNSNGYKYEYKYQVKYSGNEILAKCELTDEYSYETTVDNEKTKYT
mgnify:CR=1 FL=1